MELDLAEALSSINKYSIGYFSILPVMGKKAVLEWCMKEGMIASTHKCPKCGSQMSLKTRQDRTDGFMWFCRKKGRENAHECTKSVRDGSWFSHSHLSIVQILKMTRLWYAKAMHEYIMYEVKVFEHAVTDWCMFCREVCQEIMMNERAEKIGGFGKIVEIDESKFGKMKYGRGKPVKGEWVFGGVERESGKCFFRVVEKRDAETLLPIVRDWVLPGTTIYSDCWKAYNCLEKEGYEHLRVNHSLTYVDPETGAHTNSIEGTWSAIKRALRGTHHVPGEFDSYLAEYMWRKLHGHEQSDEAFKAFLDDLIKVYPPAAQ